MATIPSATIFIGDTITPTNNYLSSTAILFTTEFLKVTKTIWTVNNVSKQPCGQQQLHQNIKYMKIVDEMEKEWRTINVLQNCNNKISIPHVKTSNPRIKPFNNARAGKCFVNTVTSSKQYLDKIEHNPFIVSLKPSKLLDECTHCITIPNPTPIYIASKAVFSRSNSCTLNSLRWDSQKPLFSL